MLMITPDPNVPTLLPNTLLPRSYLRTHWTNSDLAGATPLIVTS